MAFMTPMYTTEAMTDTGCGDVIPTACFDPDAHSDDLRDVEHHEAGLWWARLSAPGYLDCTDWIGPFCTEDEARMALSDVWEVDPDTGDDLND